MKEIFKLVKLLALFMGVKHIIKIIDENVDVKDQLIKLRNDLTKLEMKDIDKKIKDFQTKFDSKFKNPEEKTEENTEDL